MLPYRFPQDSRKVSKNHNRAGRFRQFIRSSDRDGNQPTVGRQRLRVAHAVPFAVVDAVPPLTREITLMQFNAWPVEIGTPACIEGLQVFPLFSDRLQPVDYTLSGEAIQARTLEIEEVSKAGSVPQLLARNHGQRRVLLVEGEQLIGAKQNRVLNTSLLVPAGCELNLPVSCVEHGRWHHISRQFDSSPFGSTSKVRSTLKQSVTRSVQCQMGYLSDQSAVWREIDEQQGSLGVRSRSAAMCDSYRRCERDLEAIYDKLPYVEGAQGIMVDLVGEILTLDLFDQADTCRCLWNRLVCAAAIDNLSPSRAGWKRMHSRNDLEQRLQSLERVVWHATRPVGEGEEFRAVGERTAASVLALNGRLVHGSAVLG
jgi:hypothetical protein